MERIRAETDGLQRLIATLEEAGPEAMKEVKAVVTKGALNVKKDAQKRVGRGPYIPAYARSIGYDVTTAAESVHADIGPDKAKPQGALGNLLEYEYGTPWSAPKPHLAPALAAEEPRFAQALEDALVKALEL